MKKIGIEYWRGTEYDDLKKIGLIHQSIIELEEDEIGKLIKNIADRGYYVYLKKIGYNGAEPDYYISIDQHKFRRR